MSFITDLDRAESAIELAAGGEQAMVNRLKAEYGYVRMLLELHPDKAEQWQPLVLQSAKAVLTALKSGVGIDTAVLAAEEMLAPIAELAKQYTIHCTGHAHIDMNWLWNWPETVATVNDTFLTVDKLMDEFPTFHFSQSQTSIYQILKDYLPELYARVKERVKEGRWEVTASQWVEGDKNLASGEILFRHLLYTRRFFREEFGLAYDSVPVNYEPDTFGHCNTLPTILSKGGVKYYYFHRAANGPFIFWWQGPDGSRILAFDDRARGYGNQINDKVILRDMVATLKATGLKDYLYVYGVGDHGGGPTRRDLLNAVKMATWPIFPEIKLSTYQAFFEAVEKVADLPVIDHELNFVFEGCYTSQSNIKRANRTSENALVEAENCALLGNKLLSMPYPAEDLYLGWKHTMFNQFHDILPGSGIHATYEYAQGIFQETIARTSMVKTRTLRAIAKQVNTVASCCCNNATDDSGVNVGPGIGGGPGEMRAWGSNRLPEGAVTARGTGGLCCDPFVIFNPNPWQRSEVAIVPLWNREWADGQIIVTDDAGNRYPAQVISREPGWGHTRIDIAFPAKDIPALGYRSFSVARDVEAGSSTGIIADGKGRMENEYFAIQVDFASGAITELIDKSSGINLVATGGKLGQLQYELEAPHPMTAWVLGQVVKSVEFSQGTSDCPHTGPFFASVRTKHTFGDSSFTQRISIYAGVPRIDFNLEVDWLERGSEKIGVPALRVNFPLAISDTTANYETANGSVERSTDMKDHWSQSDYYFRANYSTPLQSVDLTSGEVPGQKWADLSGTSGEQKVGMTLLNDSKYGFQAHDNLLRMTLLRSSYEPDPLPELGKHVIRYALRPHVGDWTVSDAAREGYAYNLPLNVVATTEQTGTMPASAGFAEILTPNVMISAIKKAEESDEVIIRLYEMEGKDTLAKIKLAAAIANPDSKVILTDAIEEPITAGDATMKDGLLSVQMPAYGQVTVKIG